MQTYNAMYVQATRGKYDLQVYTDSMEKLIERVKIEQEKTTTLERPIEPDRDSQAGAIQIIEQAKAGSTDKRTRRDKDMPENDTLELNKAPIRDREIEMEM